MVIQVDVVRPEVVWRRHEFRISGSAVLSPCFVSEREIGYPFLRDYFLQPAFVVRSIIPRYGTLAHDLGHGVFSERVGVDFRYGFGIFYIILSS